MAITLIDPFDAQMPFPTDLRQRKANVNARNAIPTNARWEGMTVWTAAEQKVWRLVGGVGDANWVDETPAPLSGGRMFTYTASGDGVTREFTFPHGLDYTPTMVLVTGNSMDTTIMDNAIGNTTLGAFWVRISGNNIIISYIGPEDVGRAPMAGTNNLKWTIFVR